MCGESVSYRIWGCLHGRSVCVAVALAVLAAPSILLFAQADPLASDQAKARLPAPPQTKQQKVLDTLADIYNLHKERTDEDKLKLVKEFLELVTETEKPTDKFVLLRKAMELASDAGDAVLMCKLIDRIADDYQIDPITTKGKMLKAVAEKAKTSERVSSLAEASNTYIDQAIASQRFDYAEYIAALACRAAQRARAGDLHKQMLDRSREIQKLHAEHKKLEGALAAVRANPDDAEANLVVGRSYCFSHGNWKRGLPYLAKCSDAGLATLAQLERTAPAEPTNQVKLADGWWDLAEGKKGTEKRALLSRAGFWYEKAGSGTLTGLTRLRIDKRLEEIAKVAESSPAKAKQPERPKQLTIDLPGGVKMEFVLIPAGEFVMGSSEAERQRAIAKAKGHGDSWAVSKIPTEAPQHRVKISKSFYLGKYETTQAQWQAMMGNNPSSNKGPMNPVERVSWDQVQTFLTKLNSAFGKEGKQFGLPTEAQWEYACRAGSTAAYSFGDDPAHLGQHAWFKENSGGKTHPVGQRQPNPWGLHDMNGNVWEWCADLHGKDFYAQSPTDDPVGPRTGSGRVHRGGGFEAHLERCRSAFRSCCTPSQSRNYLGFRVICTQSEDSP